MNEIKTILIIPIIIVSMVYLSNINIKKVNHYAGNTHINEYCEFDDRAGCTEYDKPLTQEQFDDYSMHDYKLQEDDFVKCNDHFYMAIGGNFHCE
jgi:hypothetical protein